MRIVRTDAETSARMARIRQKGTKIEAAVASALRDLGLHYRKNVRKLPGSPDFANRSKRWAVFVHGCFWHHHTGCYKATIPKSNRRFWLEKFRDNKRRDARSARLLRREGYRVLVIWECQERRIRDKLTKILEPSRINS
ncbi:very short patch repair endonuclease [Bradyrhizobium sp. WBOS7]|uniref:Very short patch repair endonuclease n=1 Tax=Bradyrhizobium betae TaxID=244734 RepID=A0AAE9NEH1_9BRAD|nr:MULTISPECIES: very short patch repair endonuclease [Bradyrhizobium]MDD1570427.1 very short patch repair endonuclease [Bradyrhizobium sp. WBOS1]UUO36448.1 very short patch repair endonuclease [Bradyrhizobium sp. WBOS01]MDD1526164.1 very short patch repair endonuclease [Bradyrhizobium sp. WBOS2]MDD1577047.1 very short patch repair endonuclease [Bradyrhizobium sp. WBOS7]MDD1599358.1 very short patch repair endonuclease [Bradyrhizobium sp. WBOS16]